ATRWPSRHCVRRPGAWNGWFTPSVPSAGQNTFSSTWPDTRTASPFPTGACYRWRAVGSPSNGRTMPAAIRPRRRPWRRADLFVVFSFTCCSPALFTSVILAFWPTANERKNWRCAGPCWMTRKLSANPAQIPRASVIQTPPNSCADVRFARSVGWSAYKSSLPRLAFAYRRPSSQTPHDHRGHTVHHFAHQFLTFPKGVRRFLSETVVFSLRKPWRRLLPHEVVTLPSGG